VSETIQREVQAVFQQVFGDDSLEIHEWTTADEIDGWDSLMHINLIVALEKRFRVKFATAEISGLKDDGQNVGNLLQLLERKLSRG
jgi:acyl carrier protein